MITLALLVIILGIISYLRIDKKCKAESINNQEFNIMKGTFLEYVGVLFGACALVILVAYTCITYLP